MIELVSPSRCTRCNLCVEVCPMNVFEAAAGAPPRLARKSDCQTCFLCELYCPADALYVAPAAGRSTLVREHILEERGLLGSYRAAVGWTEGEPERRREDPSYRLLALPH